MRRIAISVADDKPLAADGVKALGSGIAFRERTHGRVALVATGAIEGERL